MSPNAAHIITEFAYLAASVLFIFSLKWLSSPETARRGVRAGEIGMVIAILATLAATGIIEYKWILIGLAIGGAVTAGPAQDPQPGDAISHNRPPPPAPPPATAVSTGPQT